MYRFVIDERSFQLDGLPAAGVASAIRALIDLVREVTSAGHGVCFDPDMFNQPVWSGLSFYQLFSTDGLDLTIDDQIAAATYFNALLRWDEAEAEMPAALEVIVAGGSPETSGTIAWAHAQAPLKLNSVACISCAAKRPLGLNEVTLVGNSTEKVWFVDDATGVLNYFRSLLSTYGTAPSDFRDLANDAFPTLDFVEGSFSGIKTMSRGLPQIADDIVRHLGALSDYGQSIFAKNWANAEASFGAKGINLSDENGKTKQNKTARKERLKTVDGKEVLFWWHSKIEPDRDRIHFNPDGVPAGGRVLIGIFCRHLTN